MAPAMGSLSIGRFGGRLSALVLLLVTYYFVTTLTWYTAMTLSKTGTYTAVKSGVDPDVQYQLSASGTSNTLNQFYGTDRIQDFANFTMSFEVNIAATAAADAVYWFCGSTALPTNENTLAGGTAVVLQVYGGSTQLPGGGMYLVRGAASGSIPNNTSTTGGTTAGILGSDKTMDLTTGVWTPVVITYTRSATSTWSVSWNGAYPITDSEAAVETWRAASGSYWGVGARCGGSTGTFSIRRLQLSTQVTAAWSTAGLMQACYSMRLVVTAYTGAVIRLRRSSDSALQDFYTNATQSYLTTAAGGTGTTYATWIGANTAFVHTWYDQSGNAYHATNATAGATQPGISLQSGKYVVSFVSTNLTKLTIANSGFKPNTIFAHWANFNSTYGTFVASSVDFEQRFGGSGATSVNGDSNNDSDWYYKTGGTKLSYNNGVATTTVLRSTTVASWNVLSLSKTVLPTGGAYSSPAFTIVGADGSGISTRSITGYMSELIMHNTAMDAAAMTDYYAERLF